MTERLKFVPVTGCPQPRYHPLSHCSVSPGLLFAFSCKTRVSGIWCHWGWGEELRDLLFRNTKFFTDIFLFKVVSVASTAREDEGLTQKCQGVVVESGVN